MMTTSSSVLVVFADPALHRSRLSRRVGSLLGSLPGVTVRDLYEHYPDFYVDARAERALIKEAALLVFAFELSWYGMPSLLKEWIDAVFRPEWTLARGGACLLGKECWVIAGCEDPAAEWAAGGRHGRPLADFLLPLEHGARACGMAWRPPHVFYDSGRAGPAAVDAHAQKLQRMLARHLNLPEHADGH